MKRVNLLCTMCGGTFHRAPSHVRATRLCSRACLYAWRKQSLGPNSRRSVAERFETFVIKNDVGCWAWSGAIDDSGYGRLAPGVDDGRRVPLRAHRVSWELANGIISDGLWVLHHCDNPPCTRPDHLFLGTAADNSADMASKGRGFVPESRGGAGSPVAKMTDESASLAIARVRSGERRTDVARSMGVSPSTIGLLVKRKTWRHLTVAG